MTLLPAPAHAGHWAWTVSGSGTATTNTGQKHTWTAPGSAALPIIVPQLSAGDGTGPVFGGGTPPTIKANANMSIIVTGTWIADGNSDNTAPTQILFSVRSSANGNYNNNGGPVQAGQADDGYGDSVVQTGSSSQIGTSATPTTRFVATKPGSISMTVSPSASASGTPGSAGGGGAGASVGPVTIGIEPQPYNFRSASVVDPATGVTHPAVSKDDSNATLSLSYAWSSTDGVLADLNTCTVNENVTWDTNSIGSVVSMGGGQKAYVPPSPPAGTDAQGHPNAYLDPVVMGGSATSGVATNTFSPDASYKGPYSTTSWWGDQIYVFSDSATGELATPMPGPASGSFRITRAIAPTGTPSGTTGTLTISSRGNSAGPKTLQ